MEKTAKKVAAGGAKRPSRRLEKFRILLYSPNEEGLKEYSEPFTRWGADFDCVTSVQKAKHLLKSKKYNLLMSDVTEYDNTGKLLMSWAKSTISTKFLTFGFTRTGQPRKTYLRYLRGADQRFYSDDYHNEAITQAMFHLITCHDDLNWVKEVLAQQRSVRAKLDRDPYGIIPVLLIGDKGLGKMSLAQIAHGMGDRCNHEFLVADCNPRQRFDYKKDSDIDNDINRIAIKKNLEDMMGRAVDGTFYVRSIGHLSEMAQEVLAEVLTAGKCINPETGKYMKFRGRIILASNHPMEDAHCAAKISPKLSAVMSQIILQLPPLSEYRSEIVPIAEAIVGYLCCQAKGRIMTLTEASKSAISRHPWQGNIVEMYEVLLQAVQSAHKLRIHPSDLLLEECKAELTEEGRVREALASTGWNKREAARELGISPTTLYGKIRKYSITKD